MDLDVLNISDKQKTKLINKGFDSVEKLQKFFPRTYEDFSSVTKISPFLDGKKIAVIGRLKSVEANKSATGVLYLSAKIVEEGTEKWLSVTWFGSYYLKNIISDWVNTTVVVCGKLDFNETYGNYSMVNPKIISRDIERTLKIYPIYRKFSGISEEFFSSLMKEVSHIEKKEYLPDVLIKDNNLMSESEAFRQMHGPTSVKNLEKAKERILYDKLFSFVYRIEQKENRISKGTIYNLDKSKMSVAEDYISSLPYILTMSQKNVLNSMFLTAKEGRRINALVQGDVGSGKTVVAFIMMLLMAEMGYQSIMLAPTVILAKQHYDNFKPIIEKYGYKAAFLGGKQSASEKKTILKDIANGEYSIIVGTHALLNPDIEYKKLALAVIDEEHRFGVEQRELLMSKAELGMHCINMTATPIPRTLASSIYGQNTDVFDLYLPDGRHPIQTAIFNNDKKIYDFLRQKIAEKQQVYVVCPWIDSEDETENIATVNSTFEEYKKEFEKDGIKVDMLNGKMKDEEIFDIISKFEKGETHILVSTTVIEVGVNIPSANVIVINNAERFGLSQLHQLRGRVGRGKDNGYCILKSADKENPRLKIIEDSTDGYEIAKQDMALRGSGNLLGTEQSGQNEYINLIIENPVLYEKVKNDVIKMLSCKKIF